MSLFHYEVVDAENQVVGAMKHQTIEQARALMLELIGAGVNSPMFVARVVERTVVKRSVTRLKAQATA